MNKFDKLKIQIKITNSKGINKSLCKKVIINENNILKAENFNMDNMYLPLGISEIKQNEIKSTVDIVFSSKVKNNYNHKNANLIDISNNKDILNIFQYLKECSIVSISYNDLNFKNIKVLACDVTLDKKYDNVDNIISTLALRAKQNQKFTVLNYGASLCIRGKPYNNKLHISIYSKYDEILDNRKAKNKLYKALLGDKIEYFKNIVRYETHLSDFKVIRNAFGLPKDKKYITLKDLQESKENVLVKKFTEVFV